MENKKQKRYLTILINGLIVITFVILTVVSIVLPNTKVSASVLYLLLGVCLLSPISKRSDNHKIEHTIAKVAGILMILAAIFLALRYLFKI